MHHFACWSVESSHRENVGGVNTSKLWTHTSLRFVRCVVDRAWASNMCKASPVAFEIGSSRLDAAA